MSRVSKPRIQLGIELGVALGLALALMACASPRGKLPPSVDAAASAPEAAAAVVAPAPAATVVPSVGDAALARGLDAYKAGQYGPAERDLKSAVQAGLSAAADQANAQKHLAFIYCTSKREALCLGAFKAAKLADPAFALSKAEAGHPMWSKTYKKAMGLK
jgi:pyruvate/2-oxoglutarate dehydrogenase complex dihydrolipoamide acyltransferase (E2) component